MPRKPQQARSKATKDAIIEAGFICVAKHGLEDASVRQIIETAGVSPGSFYEYFSNKDALIDAMYERFIHDALAMIEPLTPSIVQMSIEDLIRALLKNLEAFLLDNDQLYLSCARYAMQVDVKGLLEPASKMLTEIVTRHALNNPETMRIRDLPALAYIFVNGGIALVVRHLTDPKPSISFEQLANGLAHMVGHYVAAENRLAEEERLKKSS